MGIFCIIFLLQKNLLTAQDAFLPCDRNATKETIALYGNLKKLSQKGYLFGHQDDLAYGVNWRYEKDRSDVKDVCGDYPAVYGWDLGGLERTSGDKNLDGVPFKNMRQYIKEGYKRGGVITISWHLDNPATGGNAWDTTHGTVASVLPGGANHELFKTWLDKAASFMLSLKGDNKELIPVLFRPYHELTGTWFWWGPNNCTPEQFKILWRFTNYYLKEVKKCHNLLYVYNTGGDFKTKEEYLERYPGDDVVDMISFDTYQWGNPSKEDGFTKNVHNLLNILDSAAAETNKLTAIAETGYEAVPYANWWTDVLQKAIGTHQLAYVLLWRNHGYNEWSKKMHYYVPFKGQVSEKNFIRFYEADKTLFEKDAAKENLYHIH
ncbi:MAG: beta-mannosidase [Ferruginibacter sp.]|nr:beta-mannosidase [Ferruginibacter sp.]